MRNRAKCKLCGDIIETFAMLDVIKCKCGEIAIWGGDRQYNVAANDLSNVIRIDDEGNEIIPKILEKGEVAPKKISRRDLLDMLEKTIESYNRLPENARYSPVSNFDFSSTLELLLLILRAET